MPQDMRCICRLHATGHALHMQAMMRGFKRCVTGCKQSDDGEMAAESTSIGKRLAETNTLQASHLAWTVYDTACAAAGPGFPGTKTVADGFRWPSRSAGQHGISF